MGVFFDCSIITFVLICILFLMGIDNSDSLRIFPLVACLMYVLVPLFSWGLGN